MKLMFFIMMVLCFKFDLAGQDLAPVGVVTGNIITINGSKNIEIVLPKNVRYVGADRWILKDIADAEIHVFVEANESKFVTRHYIVQYEGFIQEKPDAQYRYSSPFLQVVRIGDKPFSVKPRYGKNGEKHKEGSEAEHIQKMLDENGYILPDGMVNVGFHHILEDDNRKEILLFYHEDVEVFGLSIGDLMADEKKGFVWHNLKEELVNIAVSKFSINWNLK